MDKSPPNPARLEARLARLEAAYKKNFQRREWRVATRRRGRPMVYRYFQTERAAHNAAQLAAARCEQWYGDLDEWFVETRDVSPWRPTDGWTT